MAEDRVDPSEQIPEADLLEQQASLDPHPLTDEESVIVIPETPADADEADRLEQQAAVLDDHEDDYPHQPS